jgi:hypothetical protein
MAWKGLKEKQHRQRQLPCDRGIKPENDLEGIERMKQEPVNLMVLWDKDGGRPGKPYLGERRLTGQVRPLWVKIGRK